jgi:GTP cyclohydrolase II
VLPDPDFSSLDLIIAVERVIAELRAARDIIVYEGEDFIRISGVESLQQGGATRLVVTAARLRWLGREVRGGAALDVTGLTEDQILALVLGKAQVPVPPLLPMNPLELAALELAKLALVLPAILVSQSDAPHLLRAPASAVSHYSAQRLSALKLITRAPVPLEGAQNSEFVVFRGGEGLRDQVAIVIGQPDLSQPVPVRLHSACLTGDLFGSLKCDCGDQLRSTTKAMAEGSGGIILYLDQEGRGTGIGNKMRAYALQAQGFDTFDADEILGFAHDERHFAFAARMLQLLGVMQVRLMTNNPAKVAALRNAGLTVTETVAIQGRMTHQNRGYLQTKRDRGGHMLDLELAARIPE